MNKAYSTNQKIIKLRWYKLKKEISKETYEILEKNLGDLKVKLIDTPPTEQELNVIYSFGYQPVEYKTLLNTERGPLVVMGTNHNDGIYILRREGNVYMLEVVRTNTIDKSTLITQTIQSMDNLLNNVSVVDLDVYDLTQIYSHVLTNQVIKPLARHMFPENELKQQRFVHIYLPRFLANMARYYMGDEKLMEESVNSDPHLVKMMIDNSPETDQNEHVDDEISEDMVDEIVNDVLNEPVNEVLNESVDNSVKTTSDEDMVITGSVEFTSLDETGGASNESTD